MRSFTNLGRFKKSAYSSNLKLLSVRIVICLLHCLILETKPIFSSFVLSPARIDNNQIKEMKAHGKISVDVSQDLPLKGGETLEGLGSKTEARVLVLYTGGTIGMLRNEKNGKQSIFFSIFYFK